MNDRGYIAQEMAVPVTATAIYFISHSVKGPTKIGISKQPHVRVRRFQVGHPFPLKIFGLIYMRNRLLAYRAERHLHAGYIERRLVGEWIDASPLDLFTNSLSDIDYQFGESAITGWLEPQP